MFIDIEKGRYCEVKPRYKRALQGCWNKCGVLIRSTLSSFKVL